MHKPHGLILPSQPTEWLTHNLPLFYNTNKHAYHGANSAALLPGSMRNKFQCFFCSGVDRKLIWNWLSGDEVIPTKLPPPWPFCCLFPQNCPSISSPSPQTVDVSCCCIEWAVQRSQISWLPLAVHHGSIIIIVIVQSSSSWCHCYCHCHCRPLHCCCHHRHCCYWLLLLTLLSLPSLLLALLTLLLPSLLLPIWHHHFIIVVLGVLLGGQSEEFDQIKPRWYRQWHGDGVPDLELAVGWPPVLLGWYHVHGVVLLVISWHLGDGGWRKCTLQYSNLLLH